jgi:hypothetical protein
MLDAGMPMPAVLVSMPTPSYLLRVFNLSVIFQGKIIPHPHGCSFTYPVL